MGLHRRHHQACPGVHRLGQAAASGVGGIGVTNFLAVAAFVAAAIYLADVRPKVKEFRRGKSSTSSGPYGPW